MKRVEACILGAAGFGGGELLRWLMNHPGVAGIRAVSRSHAGEPIHAAHPNLRGLLDQSFEPMPDWKALNGGGLVVFAAMPSLAFAGQYGQLADTWEKAGLADRLTVIDLSGDFRLSDAAAIRRWYGAEHPAPEALGSFAYGLSEWRPERLAGATRIANPGCFATAVELALLPLAGLPSLGTVTASGVTGSSGSGAAPGAGTHHPLRAGDFRAYKVMSHQHAGEIQAVLAAAGSELDLVFVPHSAPMVRGIYATLHLDLAALGLDADQLQERYRAFADSASFIRLVEDTPRVAAVVGSNFCELAVHADGKRAVVLSALDNLGKGMAGQAVQNMNLAQGWPADLGLRQAGAWPA